MKSKILFALMIAVLIAAILPVSVLAKELREDEIVFGGTYTLESGETLEGNLVVFGGTATLEEGSRVNGDVVLMGGTLDAYGEITGNVVGIGGFVELGDTATVQKDIFVLGANLDQAQGAIVEGETINGFSGPFVFNLPTDMNVPMFRVGVNPFFQLIWFILRALLWAVLAVVLVLFLPNQFNRIGKTAVQQPLISGGLGLLTVFIIPVFLIILLITIICSPLSLLGMLLLAVAWMFGLIALGLELGNRLAAVAKQDWAPALSAGVGTLILVVVINGLRAIIPCVGWVFPAIVGIVGLGAVLLTRVGTQEYPQAAPFEAGPIPPPPVPEVPAPPSAEVLPEVIPGSEEGESQQDDLPPAI